jgi:septum formation protein
MQVILASNSPRRRELQAKMGLGRFEVISPNVEEQVDGSPAPARLVTTLSARKAAAVSEGAPPGALVVAADTVVVLNGTVLGKPKDEADAFGMLAALSGRRHQVYTGVTVRRAAAVLTELSDGLCFSPLSAAEIPPYSPRRAVWTKRA